MEQSEQQAQKVNWAVTPGVAHIHNIIRVHLFRHYEQHIITYKLLMLCNLDQGNTRSNTRKKLGVLEVEEVPKGIAVSPLFSNWAISTSLFKSIVPCIVAIVRIDDDLILMSREEFEALSQTEEDMELQEEEETYE